MTQGQLGVKDSAEGVFPIVNFHPLLCHHTQKLPGFSVLLQIPLVDFAQLLGLALPNLVALVLWPAQLTFPFKDIFITSLSLSVQ